MVGSKGIGVPTDHRLVPSAFHFSHTLPICSCPIGCTQCGGAGCARAGAAQSLDNTACCINGVLNSGIYCGDGVEAPCVVGSDDTGMSMAIEVVDSPPHMHHPVCLPHTPLVRWAVGFAPFTSPPNGIPCSLFLEAVFTNFSPSILCMKTFSPD